MSMQSHGISMKLEHVGSSYRLVVVMKLVKKINK